MDNTAAWARQMERRLEDLERRRAPPAFGARVYRAGASQLITTGTVTGINFDTALRDEFGLWSGASSVQRFRVPAGGGGWFLCELTVQWDSTTGVTNPTTGLRVYDTDTTTNIVNRNGRGSYPQTTAVTSVNIYNHETWLVELGDGMEVFPWVFHNTAGANRVIQTQAGDLNNSQLPLFQAWRVAR